MKLELDTVDKTVKFNEDISLKELFKIVKRILPNGLWKDYILLTNSTFSFIGHTYYRVDFSKPMPYTSPSVSPHIDYPWISTSGSNTSGGAMDIRTTTNAKAQGTYTIEIKN